MHDNDNGLQILNNEGKRDNKTNPIIHINNNDASKYSIADGDLIEVETQRMKILGSAAVDYPHEGLISASLLFGARSTDFEYGSNERFQCLQLARKIVETHYAGIKLREKLIKKREQREDAAKKME